MDIPIHTSVSCIDGDAGQTVCVIIHPYHREVTHIVVKEKGFLGMERLVPIEFITESTPERIQLRCTREEMSNMENFIEVHYIGGTDGFMDYEAEHHYYHPYLYPDWEDELDQESLYVQEERIPPGELGIHRGTNIYATDGRVGQVDEFLISPTDHHISHVILREGHLWGQKHVTIPVSAIARIEEDSVYLSIDKHMIEKMPAIPVHWQRS